MEMPKTLKTKVPTKTQETKMAKEVQQALSATFFFPRSVWWLVKATKGPITPMGFTMAKIAGKKTKKKFSKIDIENHLQKIFGERKRTFSSLKNLNFHWFQTETQFGTSTDCRPKFDEI
tara:strand:- start:252 stop:608 length:357 start_codon:yes stop_codon:yes gene_type:complete